MRYYSIFLLTVLIGCGTESTPTFQLTTSVVGNGSITPSNGQFEKGESVTISSTPDSGWFFSNYQGDISSTENVTTITMDTDKNIISVFERREYPLNITIIGEGSVMERIYTQPKLTDYTFETVVELEPKFVDWGVWEFSGWTGDVTSTESIIQIPIKGETNITGTFTFDGNSIIRFYEYNDENQLIDSYNCGNYNSVDECSKNNTTYEYNSNGDLISETFYENGIVKRISTSEYEYDSNNEITKEELYVNGEFNSTIVYEKNTEGILVLTWKNSDNKITGVQRFDTNGNMIEQEWSNFLMINEYNSDNLIIKSIWYQKWDNQCSYEKINETWTYNKGSKNEVKESVKTRIFSTHLLNNDPVLCQGTEDKTSTERKISKNFDSNLNITEETEYYY